MRNIEARLQSRSQRNSRQKRKNQLVRSLNAPFGQWNHQNFLVTLMMLACFSCLMSGQCATAIDKNDDRTHYLNYF